MATKKFSKSKVPLIHHVIPIFDIITTALEDHIDNNALPLVVCHAALRGYLMLNKYYTLTDDSIVYRVAMSVFFNLFLRSFTYIQPPFTVLHPRYKTTYFSRAKWPEQWIEDAKKVAREAWRDNYKKATPPVRTQAGLESTSTTNHVSICFNWCPLLLRPFYTFYSAFRQQASTSTHLKTIPPLLMRSKTG